MRRSKKLTAKLMAAKLREQAVEMWAVVDPGKGLCLWNKKPLPEKVVKCACGVNHEMGYRWPAPGDLDDAVRKLLPKPPKGEAPQPHKIVIALVQE